MFNNSLTIEEKLFTALLPEKTHSYQPVPHSQLVAMIQEKLYQNNFPVNSIKYSANHDYSQMFGVINIGNGNNEQTMNIGFRNSYDKSLAVGLVAGSTVIVCSNLMFAGDIRILRKHTNGVYNDLENMIQSVVGMTAQQFERLQIDTERMKGIEISKIEMAEIAGKMFINDNLINSHQMSIIKKEINFSDTFTDPSLWTLYNHLTESLKVSHPSERMQKQTKVHEYVMQLAE